MNSSDSVIALLPAWTIPPKGFLVINFGEGIKDDVFTDKLGVLYTQELSDSIFKNTGAVGLYQGVVDAPNLID